MINIRYDDCKSGNKIYFNVLLAVIQQKTSNFMV